MMPTFDVFAAALAEYIAQKHYWSKQEARHWVDAYLEEARAEYRANGAPLGDTDAGFIAWLQPRPQPPTA